MGQLDHTQPSETPFFLVYGAEACLPPEIHLGSPRVQAFDEFMQEQLRRDDVDFVDDDGGEQQSEMHATTRRSGAIINGSCTVGSSGLATSS